VSEHPTDPHREPDERPRIRPAHDHDAPPPERPMSGWAVIALVTALVSVAASVLTLYWWLPLIPLAIGVLVLVKVSPRERRGRVLATIGLVITLFAGSCTFMLQRGVRAMVANSVGGILGALASTGSPKIQEEAIAKWASKGAMDDGLVDRLRPRYAAVAERFGAYQPPTQAGTWYGGVAELGMPPVEGLREIPDNPGSAQPDFGHTMWARARFGDHEVHVAIEIFGGPGGDSPMDVARTARPDGSVPWVSDMRFFVAPDGNAGASESR